MFIDSETKKLKKVLLHRPGNELLQLNEENKQDFLFDQIPELIKAQKEHDNFANILKSHGVEVVYIEDLMAEIIKNNNIKEEFIKDYLIRSNCNKQEYFDYFMSIKDEKQCVLNSIVGHKEINPLPNLYFTRDPFTIYSNGIIFNNMHSIARKKETIYGEYINKYHKDFMLPVIFKPNQDLEIEGGDILLIGERQIAIGASERTTNQSAIELSNELINKNIIDTSVIINLPKKRSYMHLDTIMTKINENTFTIYDEFYKDITYSIVSNKQFNIKNNDLEEVLSSVLNKKITLLRSSNKEEQWNDAYNTLAISDNKIIVYDINNKTNDLYTSNNIELIKLESSELLKGRGGPHCMSMPLVRE